VQALPVSIESDFAINLLIPMEFASIEPSRIAIDSAIDADAAEGMRPHFAPIKLPWLSLITAPKEPDLE
jgi:hypothetical protein